MSLPSWTPRTVSGNVKLSDDVPRDCCVLTRRPRRLVVAENLHVSEADVNIGEHFETFLRSIRCGALHGIVVWTPAESNVSAIAGALADALEAGEDPGSVSLIEMAGAPLGEDATDSILEPMMNGGTLVAFSSTSPELPVALADHWVYWLDNPANTYSQVMRGLRLDPSLDLRTPGVVVAVVPYGTGRRDMNRAFNWYLHSDMAQIMQGRSHRERDTTIGISPPEISIRGLCLLHARDPKGTPERPMDDIMLGDETVTWTDLKTVLASSPSYRWALDQWNAVGRLDEEKYVFGHAAYDFLDERSHRGPHGVSTALHDSIWDVVWRYRWLAADDRYIFRGQVDARWSLASSLFRPDRGLAADIGTFSSRIEATSTFVQNLRERPELVGADATDEELLAVAQHYGFPTPLLDFTRSLLVAAFFATHRQPGDHDDAIGVIYYMRGTRDELTSGREWSEHASLGDFALLRAARLHIGQVTAIEPHLKDEDNRIARQHGVFISGYQVQDLQQVAIDRILFRQRPNEIFEDELRDVTEEWLYPEGSPLQQLADKVTDQPDDKLTDRHDAKSTRLNSSLATVRLPSVPLLGSYGANLFAHLREADEFFDALREAVGDVPVDALAAVFEEYFAAANARAEAGQFLNLRPIDPTTGEENLATEPLVVATDQLAALTQIDSMRLWATVYHALSPGPAEDLLGRPTAEPIHPRTPDERVAVATSLFLAAWEQLQFVRGTAARQLVQQAYLMLGGTGLTD